MGIISHSPTPLLALYHHCWGARSLIHRNIFNSKQTIGSQYQIEITGYINYCKKKGRRFQMRNHWIFVECRWCPWQGRKAWQSGSLSGHLDSKLLFCRTFQHGGNFDQEIKKLFINKQFGSFHFPS